MTMRMRLVGVEEGEQKGDAAAAPAAGAADDVLARTTGGLQI
jgi:hypothetical protein